MTPPLFHPNFGEFPLDQIAHVVADPGQSLKLISGEIISKYSNVCDRIESNRWLYLNCIHGASLAAPETDAGLATAAGTCSCTD